MSSMLSQVQERRDVALADFYKKPPVKRKHEEQDGSIGDPSPSMPAAKLSKQEKATGVRGLVSWAENSSLPSKSMVLSDIASHTYPEACLLLLTALKEYFELGLTSMRSSSTSSRTIPGRVRVEELMAAFMKPLTAPSCPMEKAIRHLPPVGADISMFQQLHPIHEAQFCTALVKVFLSLGDSGGGSGGEASEEASGSALLASSVAWCLLDVVLTPIAGAAVVVERVSRIASLALSLQCPALLSAMAGWMPCYRRHLCKPGKAATGSKGAACDAQRQSIATSVVAQLLNDFCVLTLHDVRTLSSLPELSVDMAALFLVEHAEQNPVVRREEASDGAALEVALPTYSLLAMFADWLTARPSLAVTVQRTDPPPQLPLWREWPTRKSNATPSPSQATAGNRQLCPLQGLISLSVCGPLACQYRVSVDDRSVEKTAAAPATGGLTASAQAKYEDSLAQLHGQLLLAVSLHKATAADGGAASAAATGKDSGRRPSSSSSSPAHLLPADSLLAIVRQCHDLWKFAVGKGVDVERVMSVSVEHLAQLIQVMVTAGVTKLSKDHLKTIRDSLPSNQLLDTVLEFLSEHSNS